MKISWLRHNNLPKRRVDSSNTMTQPAVDYKHNQLLEKWQPQQKQLIAVNGYSRELPPIYCQSLQKSIAKNLKNKYRYMAIGYLIPAVIFLANFLSLGFDGSALSWFLIFLLMSTLYVVEYNYGLSTTRGIKERALFFHWLFSDGKPKKCLFACILFTLSIGLIQALTTYWTGGTEQTFFLYGAMYEQLAQGEHWRLLTGPLLHYSILHYMINFLSLVMVGTLCLCLMGYKSMFIFVAGNGIGAYCQYAFGAQILDSCGGISFGIYSLFGFIISAGMLARPVLPKGFSASLTVIVLIGLLFSELLSENSATVGHLAGLTFGIICSAINGLLFKSARNDRYHQTVRKKH